MARILKFEEGFSGRGGVPRSEAARRVRQNENSPRRVLSEILLIVGGVGMLVLLTTIFLGTPPP
jgi:hypothetical protein